MNNSFKKLRKRTLKLSNIAIFAIFPSKQDSRNERMESKIQAPFCHGKKVGKVYCITQYHVISWCYLMKKGRDRALNAQLKKGVIELCVLSLLRERDRYGYELVEVISRNIQISEGTIYPLLRKFRQEGYVDTYLEESQSGPPRKYYRLTSIGKVALARQMEEWSSFVTGVNSILRRETDA